MSKKVRKIANRSLRLSRIEPKTQVNSAFGYEFREEIKNLQSASSRSARQKLYKVEAVRDSLVTFSPTEVTILGNYFKKEHVFFIDINKRTSVAAKVIVDSNTKKFGLILKRGKEILGQIEGVPRKKWIFIECLENKTLKVGKAKIQGIGTFLLDRAFFEAVKKRFNGMLALDWTLTSYDFYIKLGFEKIQNEMRTPLNLRTTWKQRLLCKAHMSNAAIPLPFYLLDIVRVTGPVDSASNVYY